MGLDGGTKITRSDVLRGQSWRLTTRDGSRSTRGGSVSTSETLAEKKLDRETEKRIKWTTCALSEKPLEAPVVADYLGHLYNKSAVLTFLLNRKGVFDNEMEKHFYTNIVQSHGERFAHLQRRRDVFELKMKNAELWSRPLECSVSGLECLSSPFSALVTCGHVFSERAIEEMKDMKCMECSESFRGMDVVHLNCQNASFQKTMEENKKKRNEGRRQPSTQKRRKTDSKQPPVLKHPRKDKGEEASL